jgi:hypothetical protein
MGALPNAKELCYLLAPSHRVGISQANECAAIAGLEQEIARDTPIPAQYAKPLQ